MRFSDFGNQFAGETGIGQLMDDLTADSQTLNENTQRLMLGGGNPARIPTVEQQIQHQFDALVGNPRQLADTLTEYGGPGGQENFRNAVAHLLNREYDWGLTGDNVAVTNGSQSAFFLLFNLFGGSSEHGTRKIILPMVPEYIGYGDLGTTVGTFAANRPAIEELANNRFKYRVNFDTLSLDSDSGAMCVSRPTNPTANVLTDAEIEQLHTLAQQHEIPLIIDGAYGSPFPGMIHQPVNLPWSDNMILSLSLSKLGLPALRTGIVIANTRVVEAVQKMNAIINLSTGSLGQQVMLDMIRNNAIVDISRDVIQPLYKNKLDQAVRWFDETMGDFNARLHVPGGAFFLWMWFPDLAITVEELYQRLKTRGVIVVPGQYFFPGLDSPDDIAWSHRHQCIRVSYAGDESVVQQGIKIIADEVKSALVR